ncbi:unnamed protein product [Orchesella dallaii]|uniref:Uncharacterized protein n=1 Tax=Orchesella dallaii TaxID=48710 RepID=A0ABP1RA60_9HEXA
MESEKLSSLAKVTGGEWTKIFGSARRISGTEIQLFVRSSDVRLHRPGHPLIMGFISYEGNEPQFHHVENMGEGQVGRVNLEYTKMSRNSILLRTKSDQLGLIGPPRQMFFRLTMTFTKDDEVVEVIEIE